MFSSYQECISKYIFILLNIEAYILIYEDIVAEDKLI